MTIDAPAGRGAGARRRGHAEAAADHRPVGCPARAAAPADVRPGPGAAPGGEGRHHRPTDRWTRRSRRSLALHARCTRSTSRCSSSSRRGCPRRRRPSSRWPSRGSRNDAGNDARRAWRSTGRAGRRAVSGVVRVFPRDRRRADVRVSDPRAGARVGAVQVEPEPLVSAAPRCTWTPRLDAREEEVPRHQRAAVRQRSAPPRPPGRVRPDRHLRAVPALVRRTTWSSSAPTTRTARPIELNAAKQGVKPEEFVAGGLGAAPDGLRATSASRSTPSTPPTRPRTSTTPS